MDNRNPSNTSARSVERIVAGRATSDGAGVKLTRVLTHELQRRLDPFLMLDAFRFETLNFFFDMARRVSVSEVTPW